MELPEFLALVERGATLVAGTDVHRFMIASSHRALGITARLNAA